MVFGSFNKMMNKILSGETGDKIAKTLYRNTIEAPLRVLEFGDKYGITPPGLTKATDKLIYEPLRQTINLVVEKGKKKNPSVAQAMPIIEPTQLHSSPVRQTLPYLPSPEDDPEAGIYFSHQRNFSTQNIQKR